MKMFVWTDIVGMDYSHDSDIAILAENVEEARAKVAVFFSVASNRGEKGTKFRKEVLNEEPDVYEPGEVAMFTRYMG